MAPEVVSHLSTPSTSSSPLKLILLLNLPMQHSLVLSQPAITREDVISAAAKILIKEFIRNDKKLENL